MPLSDPVSSGSSVSQHGVRLLFGSQEASARGFRACFLAVRTSGKEAYTGLSSPV